MKKSELNLLVIQNFILHITHCDNFKAELDFKTEMKFTPEMLYKMAVDYIKEDHVDGEENPDDDITKKVYNVSYLNKDGELIDQTQIDEKSAKLAWELFKEFGHTKKKGMYLEWEEDEEDLTN